MDTGEEFLREGLEAVELERDVAERALEIEVEARGDAQKELEEATGLIERMLAHNDDGGLGLSDETADDARVFLRKQP